MIPFRNIYVPLIGLALLLSSTSAIADDEIEDLIDIAESKDKVIAVIEGEATIPYRLRSNEDVGWRDAKGYLGSILTSLNFLVVSTSSSAWHVLPLKVGESENSMVSLSSNMALLVSGDRAVGFDTKVSRFIELKLAIHDAVLVAETGKHVALVVTSSRAYGLAVGSSAFSEMRLRIKETIAATKVTASKATVRTSDRLLVFEAKSAAWREHRLD